MLAYHSWIQKGADLRTSSHLRREELHLYSLGQYRPVMSGLMHLAYVAGNMWTTPPWFPTNINSTFVWKHHIWTFQTEVDQYACIRIVCKDGSCLFSLQLVTNEQTSCLARFKTGQLGATDRCRPKSKHDRGCHESAQPQDQLRRVSKLNVQMTFVHLSLFAGCRVSNCDCKTSCGPVSRLKLQDDSEPIGALHLDEASTWFIFPYCLLTLPNFQLWSGCDGSVVSKMCQLMCSISGSRRLSEFALHKCYGLLSCWNR